MWNARWFTLGLALAACDCEGGPSATPKTATPATAPARVREHMAAHLDAAAELEAAIVTGRLRDARDKATWLTLHDMNMPRDWAPYVDDMRLAALRIASASDLATAGAQLGRLGRACGACHEAQHATVAFADTPAPADEPSAVAQMRRHRWAAARLWEGVIGPADARWDEGTRVLASVRFDASSAMHVKPNVEVIELAEHLREQVADAAVLTDRVARANAFGAMLETCSSCHRIVRPGPVVGDSEARSAWGEP